MAAEAYSSEARTRLYEADEHARRAPGTEGAPSQGPLASQRRLGDVARIRSRGMRLAVSRGWAVSPPQRARRILCVWQDRDEIVWRDVDLRSREVEQDGRIARTTGSERFRRESRLRSSQDFQRVRRRGKRQQGQWLILAYARRPTEGAMPDTPEPPRPPTRVGFSVNKRVGSAVRRNRVKRRLREVIRRRLWNAQPGWDMIVIARPEAADVEYADLASELQDLLTRARLLR